MVVSSLKAPSDFLKIRLKPTLRGYALNPNRISSFIVEIQDKGGPFSFAADEAETQTEDFCHFPGDG